MDNTKIKRGSMTRILGEGKPAADYGSVSGPLLRLDSVADVVALLDKEEETYAGSIVLVSDAGATFLAPIFPELAGIICLNGNRGSHLAIVSRDFGIPALFSCVLSSADTESGTLVTVDTTDGAITVAD
jgi:phosphoenolpyruvate-protein kinase (PTS system EI component)